MDRCPSCRAETLRPTLARMMARCARCAWEGFPLDRVEYTRRIPLRNPRDVRA